MLAIVSRASVSSFGALIVVVVVVASLWTIIMLSAVHVGLPGCRRARGARARALSASSVARVVKLTLNVFGFVLLYYVRAYGITEL